MLDQHPDAALADLDRGTETAEVELGARSARVERVEPLDLFVFLERVVDAALSGADRGCRARELEPRRFSRPGRPRASSPEP